MIVRLSSNRELLFHSHTVCIQWSSAKIKVVSMFRNLDLAVSPPNVRTLRRPLRDHRLEHASHVPFKSIRESKRYGFPRPCPLFSDRRRRLLMSFPTPPLSLPSRARHLGSVSHCNSGEGGSCRLFRRSGMNTRRESLCFLAAQGN